MGEAASRPCAGSRDGAPSWGPKLGRAETGSQAGAQQCARSGGGGLIDSITGRLGLVPEKPQKANVSAAASDEVDPSTPCLVLVLPRLQESSKGDDTLADRQRLYLQGALRVALDAKGFRWVESFAFSDEGDLKGKEAWVVALGPRGLERAAEAEEFLQTCTREAFINGEVREFKHWRAYSTQHGPASFDPAAKLALETAWAYSALLPRDQKPPDDGVEEFSALWVLGYCSSVLALCEAAGAVEQVVALHDSAQNSALHREWPGLLSLAKPLPLEDVVKYLGINAAQYFLFLQEYTKWLVVPAALGLAIHVAHAASGSNTSITTSTGASLFMFFITVWSTLFTEHWKRRRFALNYKFGFHEAGERAYDPGAPASFQVGSAAMAQALAPVCGGAEAAKEAARQALELSNYSRNLNTLLDLPYAKSNGTVVSLTIKTIIPMVLLLGVVGIVVHLLLWIGSLAEKRFQNAVMQNLPVLLYLVVANVLEKVYLFIGAKLTDWEGHPIHTQHLKSLTAKAASFQLVNYLGWFAYVAFWMMDISLLQSQLWMFMTVKQAIALSMETLVPMAQHRWRRSREAREEAERKKDDGKPAAGGLRAQCERQLALGRVDLGGEYLQLAVLFAASTSFAVAFPLGPFLALIFTLVSRSSDAFKLLKLSQRAPPRHADTVVLDTWLDIFEAISTCAVCVNFGCWALAGGGGWLQVVLMEHAVLFFKFYASWAIPDRPVTVERKEVAIETLMHRGG